MFALRVEVAHPPQIEFAPSSSPLIEPITSAIKNLHVQYLSSGVKLFSEKLLVFGFH